jgi:hypothetical protein
MVRLCGKVLLNKGPQDVIPGIFWSANFSFARASFGKILYTEPMEYVFFGEEIIMLKRVYQEYSMFTPNKVICYHLWSRDHRPTFWENFTETKPTSGETVVEQVDIDSTYLVQHDTETMTKIRVENRQSIMRELGMTEEKQNVESFYEYCGIDFANKSVSNKALFGGVEETDQLI